MHICVDSKHYCGIIHVSLGNPIPESINKLFRHLGTFSSHEEKG